MNATHRCPSWRAVIAATVSIALTACSSTSLPATAAQPQKPADSATPPATPTLAYDLAGKMQLPKVAPREVHGLHNVFQLSAQIVSGSEPHGEEAFAELQKLGVKTILSVDGKVPEAELATKYGMRYVHVPIQYKGISDDELLRIAKTFREVPGPFYVHCFHGKHRGPAAAAVGRVVLDAVPREQALAEMRQWCGTAKSYEGLFRTIATQPIPTAQQTASLAWSFPAAQPLGGFREGMIEAARADDHLKALMGRGWQADPAHPDVDAANEATKLADVLAQCAKLEDVTTQPKDFQDWMATAVRESAALRDALTGQRKEANPKLKDLADGAYKKLAKGCADCHATYRN